MELAAKRQATIDRLHGLGSALVAYSGGVDSALLLALAVEALGDKAVAFTALSPAVAPDELEGARAVARQLGARHVEKRSGELEDPRYASNPVNRCYYCKTELYTLALAEARALGRGPGAAGPSAGERAACRRGLRAASGREGGRPLAKAGLPKQDIPSPSPARGLPTGDKPQQPCLSSR